MVGGGAEPERLKLANVMRNAARPGGAVPPTVMLPALRVTLPIQLVAGLVITVPVAPGLLNVSSVIVCAQSEAEAAMAKTRQARTIIIHRTKYHGGGGAASRKQHSNRR